MQIVGLGEVMSDADSGVVARCPRDHRRRCSTDAAPDNNGAGITWGKKHEACRDRHGGSVYQGRICTGVAQSRDVHQTGGEDMRLLQAESLGVQVGDADKIWVPAASSSPRNTPDAIVNGEVS